MMSSQSYQNVQCEDNNETTEPATHHQYGFKINSCHAFLMMAVVLILLFLAWFISNLVVTAKSDCLGAPYLYISHLDSRNIFKYTRDGCPLSQNVLWFGGSDFSSPGAIRSMTIHSYNNDDDALYIANSGGNAIDHGRVLVFSTCAGLSGRRSYLKTLVDIRTVPGARHTDSITFDGHGYMYASFQHTDVVLRFSDTTFQPVSLPSLSWFNDLYNKDGDSNVSPPQYSKRNYTIESEFYDGTFVQFGYPGLHDEYTQGLRAIVWIESLHQLWIANQDLHRIIIVDNIGRYIAKVKVKNPTGLILDSKHSMVFVGSKKGSKDTGSVFGVDIKTRKVVKTFTLLGGETMSHPTGLAVHGDVLYVAEQSVNVVLTFNITTERFIRQIIGPIVTSGIESLVLSNC